MNVKKGLMALLAIVVLVVVFFGGYKVAQSRVKSAAPTVQLEKWQQPKVAGQYKVRVKGGTSFIVKLTNKGYQKKSLSKKIQATGVYKLVKDEQDHVFFSLQSKKGLNTSLYAFKKIDDGHFELREVQKGVVSKTTMMFSKLIK